MPFDKNGRWFPPGNEWARSRRPPTAPEPQPEAAVTSGPTGVAGALHGYLNRLAAQAPSAAPGAPVMETRSQPLDVATVPAPEAGPSPVQPGAASPVVLALQGYLNRQAAEPLAAAAYTSPVTETRDQPLDFATVPAPTPLASPSIPDFVRASLGRATAEAREPSFGTKAAASIITGVGDVEATAGGALRWLGAERPGAKLVNAGEQIRREFEQPAVPAETPVWQKLSDPNYWATNMTRSIPFMASLVIPGLLAMSGAGAAAGAIGLTGFAKTVLGAVGGGVLQRAIEGSLEAGGTYQEALAQGKSDQEARQAATRTFKGNLPLAAMDVAELLTTFAPIPGLRATGALGKALITAGRIGLAAAQEAGEEAYQEVVQRRALGDTRSITDILKTPETREAALIGGLHGGLLGASGTVVETIKAEVAVRLPENVRARYEQDVEAGIQAGLSRPQAEFSAMDEVAKSEAGRRIIEQVARDVSSRMSRQIEQGIQWQGQATPPAAVTPTTTAAQIRTADKEISAGSVTHAKTEKGQQVDMHFALVEADDLIASHDTFLKQNPSYPQELQPRERDRAVYEAQVHSIAANLEPEWLGDSPKVGEGAPIVGSDLVVESGNGRVIALRRAYESRPEKAKQYRDWLSQNAARFGISPDAVTGAKAPVLIRVRDTEVDRVQFTQDANISPQVQMSETEQAMADAKRLTGTMMDMFRPSEDGEILTLLNNPFIQKFAGDIVGTSSGQFYDEQGRLSQAGVRRVKNAIFVKAYGDSGAIARLAESTDNNVRNITNGMLIAAPKVAKMREAITRGSLHDLDITPEIVAAMNQLSDLREHGQTVEEYVNQMHLLEAPGMSPLAKLILKVLEQRKRSQKRVAQVLTLYVDAVTAVGNPNQLGLLGTTTVPTKEEVFSGVMSALERMESDGLGAAQPGLPTASGDETVRGGQDSSVSGQQGPPGGQRTGGAAGGAPGGTQAFAGKRPTVRKTQAPAQPIRKQDIVKFLSQKLSVPIRWKRFREHALGIFKVQPEVIRTKLAQDLPVIAHEVGHFLDKQYGFSGMTNLVGELHGLGLATSRPSYSAEQVMAEGIAEFTRLYLTDHPQAQKRAPNLFSAFEQTIDPEVKDILLTARQDIYNWVNQPAKARVLGMLSIGEKPSRPMTLDRLYTAAVDELRPLEKFVKEVTGGQPIKVTQDPFAIAWLTRGWTGKAEAFLHDGVVDNQGRRLSASLESILKPVSKRLDDFRAYIVARRTLELSRRGIETGIDSADAQEVVNELGTPDFVRATEELIKFQNRVIEETLVKSGIVSGVAKEAMFALNEQYVPFYRLFDESNASVGFGRKTFAEVPSPVKAIKGSGRPIIDPLESVIRNVYLFTNVAERNAVGRAVVNLAERTEGAGKWVEQVPAPMRPVQFTLEQIEKQLKDLGADLTGIDTDELVTIFKPSGFTSRKENVLTVYRLGKPDFFQVEPELYRSLLMLDRESADMAAKIFSYPASLLRAGATLTPEFIGRNPVRDQFTAFLFSRYGYKPGVDIIRGLFHAVKKDALYWEWLRSGGGQATLVSLDRDYLQGSLREMLTQRISLNPIEWLRGLSEFMEQGTRIGEYGRAMNAEMDKGASRLEAMMRAGIASRDITVDFGRKGQKTAGANRAVAFFNASIQGTDKLRRAMMSDPKGFAVRAVMSITLPSVLLYLVNKDDERYKELPQWQKDLFWIIPTKDRLIRIPKPFEAGILFGTVPERVLKWIDQNDPHAFDELGKNLRDAMLPSLIPTAFVPWAEVWGNRSLFTGLRIVPQREEKEPLEQQYGPYTSETAKALGKVLKRSPRMIDQVIAGYTGGLGKLALDAGDVALKATGVTRGPAKPTPEDPLGEFPGIRGFVARSFAQPQSIERFYRRKEELETLYDRAQAGTGQMSAQEAQELQLLRSVAQALTDARKVERAIHGSAKLSPDVKRDLLRQIDLNMIILVRRALGYGPEQIEPLLEMQRQLPAPTQRP